MILAGAGALIVGGLIFKYWRERKLESNKEEERNILIKKSYDEFMKDIECLGPVIMEKG